MIAVTSQRSVDGCLALANMELLAHALGLGALYCGFAAAAIDGDPGLREYFGITEQRRLDSCLIVGHTDLTFHRTAPPEARPGPLAVRGISRRVSPPSRRPGPSQWTG